MHDPLAAAPGQADFDALLQEPRDLRLLPLGLAGVGHYPDLDAALLGGQKGAGQLPGGEIEDSQVDGGLGVVDGPQEAVRGFPRWGTMRPRQWSRAPASPRSPRIGRSPSPRTGLLEPGEARLDLPDGEGLRWLPAASAEKRVVGVSGRDPFDAAHLEERLHANTSARTRGPRRGRRPG